MWTELNSLEIFTKIISPKSKFTRVSMMVQWNKTTNEKMSDLKIFLVHTCVEDRKYRILLNPLKFQNFCVVNFGTTAHSVHNSYSYRTLLHHTCVFLEFLSHPHTSTVV